MQMYEYIDLNCTLARVHENVKAKVVSLLLGNNISSMYITISSSIELNLIILHGYDSGLDIFDDRTLNCDFAGLRNVENLRLDLINLG